VDPNFWVDARWLRESEQHRKQAIYQRIAPGIILPISLGYPAGLEGDKKVTSSLNGGHGAEAPATNANGSH
jgi:hypothetical protein